MPGKSENAKRADNAVRKRQARQPTGQDPILLQEQAPPLTQSVERAVLDPGRARPADLLALQRMAGNRAVSGLIQAKLTAGPVGDRYEQEADRVAGEVVDGPVLVSAIQAEAPVASQPKNGNAVGTVHVGGTPASRIQRQVWTKSHFQGQTTGGKLARRDKALKAIDSKLDLFHYQKQKCKLSQNDRILGENLRVLKAIFGELGLLAEQWLNAPGNADSNRRTGMTNFKNRLDVPGTLQDVEAEIVIDVVAGKGGDTGAAQEALDAVLPIMSASLGDFLGGSGRDEFAKSAQATPEQNVAGGSFGLLFGLLGLASSGKSLAKGLKSVKQANQELELLQYKPKGQEELFGAVSLLEKQRSQAKKGIASDTVGVISALNGIVNGISTIFTGVITKASGAAAAATASLTANITFAFGYGVGAIVSFIQAIRDFWNVHKRRKGQQAVAKVISAYEQRAAKLKQDMDDLIVEFGEAPDRDAKRDVLFRLGDRNQDLMEVEKRRNAFAVSKRKQGAWGKGISGGLNLVATGGGIALTTAGIAAAAGAAAAVAAAGPVGWILAGVALVGALGYFIGKKIKQSIRASNVKRMRQEVEFVKEYIDQGKVNSVPSPAYDRGGRRTVRANKNIAPHRQMYDRMADAWHRFLVQPEGVKVEKKGWFNKLFSRSKSGTLTMNERKKELEAYLKKYDTEAAGETALAGIVAALAPGEEGDTVIELKIEDPDRPDQKKTTTMRQIMLDTLEHYFPGKSQDMRASLLSTDDELRMAAEKRLLSKLKLG